eukprot:TRINITY_DN4076_c0_g1_i1.p1 TRINITY_DN4076_c0_g1~~TRINITY_DN4076_c0_g1_i1.p1  ORF type:complete len:120 (-),score=29.53 TRINITY_DN4076_c0_g1_i1:172-531(-)
MCIRDRYQRRVRGLTYGSQMYFRVLSSVNLASARIFGNLPNPIGNSFQTGIKYLRQTRRGPSIRDYYMPQGTHQVASAMLTGYIPDRVRANMITSISREKRGKLPVKKGQGKRARNAAK